MVESPRQFYEFGAFRLDARKRRLLRDDSLVPLTPKAFDTLLVLIEKRGGVIEKDDLMEKVWPGIAVEENNLTQNISALRKALGEKRGEPQYILTIPGTGYRFIANVRESTAADELSSKSSKPDPNEDAHYQALISFKEETSENRVNRRGRSRILIASALVITVALAGVGYRVARRSRGATPTSDTHIKSIAVLPFKPLAAGETDVYLGIGMADALITKLSRIKQITVRPTSSVLRYASSDVDPIRAGSALEVNSVLDGRVQRVGERIRVTVQLLRASDGTPIWADKFDEKYTDIFSLEDHISEEVAASLMPALTGQQKEQLARHYTEDTDAYQSYIKGRYYWNKRTAEAVSKAVDYFEDAVLKDPNYALAYAGLADAYATLRLFDKTPEDVMPKARSAALKALELDDNLAEAHAALAYVKHRYEWDWAGAEQEFKRAIALNPDYATAHQWYGWYLVTLGSYDAAHEEFARAQQDDPLSLYVNLTMGAPLFYSRRYDEAAKEFKGVIELDPSFPLAHRWLAKTYQQQQRYDEALAEFQKFATLNGIKLDEIPAVGSIYALTGKPSAARAVIAELKASAKHKSVSPYHVATIFATLGEKDSAFQWLDKAYQQRDSEMVLLKIEPEFDSLRSDSRFADLSRKVGIPK